MYEPTIGLEIHVELKTKTKMFCDCLNDPNEKHPNINVCPICLGHPGVLPTINKKAVEAVLKLGLALNSQIPETSKFDRKNYFYPDLPKGYQISQYDKPLVLAGELNGVRITRIHLEEDAGRLVHATSDKGQATSLVDFNRAGLPLMELVTEPDIKSVEQAVKFAKELQLILRYLEVSDADMEKGQMRVEVNISLSKDNQRGTKVELKNLNSFRSVAESIDYEIKRQTEVLEKGAKV
jgi:aspartyl-tRNA(Asn)/glutamyl-tRNA(Gln) amidotransferase subunit B